MEPRVGDAVEGPATRVATISEVVVARRSGRPVVRITATPERPACRVDPASGARGGWSDEGLGSIADVRFRRSVSVFVEGTGRGDRPAVPPRALPFGQRSAVVGLRWTRWGGSTAVGRGAVEFNDCASSCAEARPQYFPVRVLLRRPRDCGEQHRYSCFAFRYTTPRRPSGLPRSYRESFAC